jgi:hypothetical protein
MRNLPRLGITDLLTKEEEEEEEKTGKDRNVKARMRDKNERNEGRRYSGFGFGVGKSDAKRTKKMRRKKRIQRMRRNMKKKTSYRPLTRGVRTGARASVPCFACIKAPCTARTCIITDARRPTARSRCALKRTL